MQNKDRNLMKYTYTTLPVLGSSVVVTSDRCLVFTCSRMIDIDTWIAANLAFLLNIAQLRPSMPRRDWMSSFDGSQDPSEPTTSTTRSQSLSRGALVDFCSIPSSGQ
jgi:hypothetical protein